MERRRILGVEKENRRWRERGEENETERRRFINEEKENMRCREGEYEV